jgi:AcrR family transcriptional regulator
METGMNQSSPNSKGQQTTRRILDAAARIFSDVGFEGARVDEIARAAGVNKAMIYYHIGDKKALYARVIHNAFGNAVEQFTFNIKPAQSPEDKLRAYIRNVADVVDQHPELAAIMLREQASGGKNLPETVGQDLARIIGIITEILDEGVEKDVFVKTIPFLVHMMIIGSVVFVKMSSPIRSKHPALSDTLSISGNQVSGMAAAEIENLVINAVKKQ